MKSKSSFKKVFALVLFLLFMIGVKLNAQKTVEIPSYKKFKISIEKTENGLKMKSLEGTAWIDLSFSLKNDKPQAIDEFGMTSLKDTKPKESQDLANFKFTISKTDEGVTLKGLEGTAWKELSFSILDNEKKIIDQNGMTKLN
ncbi:hypothetical protein [Aureivirga sp. CE67]|uniref:hypothetical protein n=1 Tax=Aureivirga sp. CE67 TaxID=1788983 RepID=UPI0018C9D7FB|nr:hypothetical protein [Aureivirga sp. CE67]